MNFGSSMEDILNAMPKNSKLYGTLRNKIEKKNSNAPIYPVKNQPVNNHNSIGRPIDAPLPPTPEEMNENFVVACEWVSKNLFIFVTLHFKNAEGQFQKARKLYNESKQFAHKIDIHWDNDRAFRHSCYYGFLGIAKWLYKLSGEMGSQIDIRGNNDYAFYYACENKHYGTAYWLSTLCPSYKFEINWSIN
jgi:hypothetical protein